MGGIEGIPVGAVDFFAELEVNNTRQWWAAHKEAHERLVRDPMTALGEALAGEFGAAKVFRPHRDVRFSADKSPYKTHQGVVIETGPRMGWYVQISARGLMVAAGWYAGSPTQIARYREAVSGPQGAELERIVARLRLDGYEIGGEVLASRPRGVERDHPRLELLRHKSLTVAAEYGVPEWLESAEVVERVRTDWRAFEPLMDWLGAQVGEEGSAA